MDSTVEVAHHISLDNTMALVVAAAVVVNNNYNVWAYYKEACPLY